MRVPSIQGVIDRRILVNYHVDPNVMRRILPSPFRPKTIRGRAIAGICLIRLRDVRPSFLPLPCGIRSENAAHRIAVEWEEDGATHAGVYIPRRDTDSCLNSLVGGRLFPGEHHHAKFTIDEQDDQLSVALSSDDGQTRVSVQGHVAERIPDSSIFASLEEASSFFKAGSLGYSQTKDPGRFDGLELVCQTWHTIPLEVERVESSYFEDRSTFPIGTVEFDCALLMRGIPHEWKSRNDLCCPVRVGA